MIVGRSFVRKDYGPSNQRYNVSSYYKDPDPQETLDWIEALEGVIEH